jgi:hypothetical protein
MHGVEPALTDNRVCESLPLEALVSRPLSVEFTSVKASPYILTAFVHSVERKPK